MPEKVIKQSLSLLSPNNVDISLIGLRILSWLEPLRGKGSFKDPPAIVRDEEKKTFGFPPWPESRYLARMAVHEVVKAKVLEIALSIETDNIRVHEDLVDAALAMPAETAVGLAPKVLSWLKSPYSDFLA